MNESRMMRKAEYGERTVKFSYRKLVEKLEDESHLEDPIIWGCIIKTNVG